MSFRSHYSASNRDDVSALYRDMMALTNDQQITATFLVHEHRLMLPRGWLRFLLWMVSIRGAKARLGFLRRVYMDQPQVSLNLWKQTADYILNGKDREDRDSVGGWSQREIDLFCEVACRVFGTHEDPTIVTGISISEMTDEDAVLAVARTLSPYGTGVQIQRDVHRLTGRNLGISRVIHILEDWEEQKQVVAVDGEKKSVGGPAPRRQIYYVTTA